MARSPYATGPYWRYYRQVKRTRPDCALCGEPGADSVDHIRPVSSFPAGTPASVISSPMNLQPAHLTCNVRAGAKRQPARTSDSRY
jgi:5-methylcytosine-specific restriction endonuclease McrA